MDELILKSNRVIAEQLMDFKRSLYSSIDWTNRLIGIMGPRGTGKTTLLLQRLKSLPMSGSEAIFVI